MDVPESPGMKSEKLLMKTTVQKESNSFNEIELQSSVGKVVKNL